MSHVVVKICVDDDGTTIDNPVWHLYETDGGGHHALCTVEFLGGGESRCVYETKEVKRGGITCERCLEILRRHKSIRL
jgi:hypothetical protein